MNNYSYLNEFKNYKLKMNVKEKTVNDYMLRIKRFTDWIIDMGRIDNNLLKSNKSNKLDMYKLLKRKDISDYIMQFKENNSMSTTQKERTAIQQWFKYLIDRMDLIEYNIALGIDIPKDKIKKQKVFMDLSEGYELLNTTNNPKSKLAIGFMLYQGLRIEEVSNVKYSDINLDKHILTIIGKNDKERRIPLRKEMEILINEYKEKMISINSNGYLFYNPRSGKSFTPNGIRKMFNIECDRLNFIGEQYHPHSLRKLCATELYKNGHSDILIQKMLGHSNVSTTRNIYIAVQEDDLFEAVRG